MLDSDQATEKSIETSRGRPRLQETERLAHRMSLSLNDKQHDFVERVAAKHRMTHAQALRHLVDRLRVRETQKSIVASIK